MNTNDQFIEAVRASLNELEEGKHSQKSVAALIQMTTQTVRLNPGAFVPEILRYTLMQSDRIEEQSATIERLLGGEHMQSLTQHFPPAPPSSDVRAAWDDFSQYILDAVDPGNVAPIPKLGPYALLWHNCLEQIASGQMADTELAKHMHVFEKHLVSPHSQQALLSALFCRWVFQAPEPIFKDHHPPSALANLNIYRMASKYDSTSIKRVY
jgi:hypothetical protein